MTRKMAIWLAVITLMACMTPERAERNLVGAMAALDQAFIPALMQTGIDSEEDLAATMQTLVKEWDYFKGRFYRYERLDTSWQATLDQAELALTQADELMAGGDKLSAHAALQSLRNILVELRNTREIDYYLDGLTAFHEPMEAIVRIVRGKSASNLTNSNINAIRALFPEARTRWDAVSSQEFDAPLYRFNEEQATRLQEQIALEDNALDILEQALISRARNSIVVAAQGIEPEFMELYRLFGSF